MFAGFARSRLQRRGVILVVILGMLGLLSLIGVTFATFSGQAQISARNFSQAMNWPDSSEMMDFALSQLIDDTTNPKSAIRGHSLKRDMYGNDAQYNGYLASHPVDGSAFGFKSVSTTAYTSSTTGDPRIGLFACDTNISLTDNTFYGYNFNRWIVQFPATRSGSNYFVGTSYEILIDDTSDPLGSGHRVFFLASVADPLAPALSAPTTTPATRPDTSFISPEGTRQSSLLAQVPANTPFVLDGRYLHAFNGPGMEALGFGISRYGNFRVNGNVPAVLKDIAAGTSPSPNDKPAFTDPNSIPSMDEDYDACDLENWFLALQSADGSIVIPSFHRPGILVCDNVAKDPLSGSTGYYDWTSSSVLAMSKILRPRAVDHNNNTTTFPDLYPDANGKIHYDIDNDGDGTTDSVWLDLGYPARRNTEGQLYKPLFSFMVIGLNGKLPLNTAGNLQLRDVNGTPAFETASHFGNSPSEIDPIYALQNANGSGYSQVDNAGFPVAVTQLRNLLAGTRLPDNGVNNQDINTVSVAGASIQLPNGFADSSDAIPMGGRGASVTTPAVAGRWGEADSVPQFLPLPASSTTPYVNVYVNPVRAGLSNQSFYNLGLSGLAKPFGDVGDDNFNTFDPWPYNTSTGALASESPLPGSSFTYPADYYDAAGAINFPVERIRRFVTPIDAAGDGVVTSFNTPNPSAGGLTAMPAAALQGGDKFGRVSYFKHFRPPGLATATPTAVPPSSTTTSGVTRVPWYPASSTAGQPTNLDKTNNLYHAFNGARNPIVNSPPVLAGMPADVTPTSPAVVPTFDQYVNSYGNSTIPNFVPYSSSMTDSNPYYLASPNLNEADEMSLYDPKDWDQPFGPADIEWLYRQQDTDGSSLSSRLASLAPISFLNPLDGPRRRRLFATDAWETTGFAWANDNPYGAFPNNSRFLTVKDASLATLGRSTPSLAHRDRRINLNYPLPVSNDPTEPVRQKWIRETYQLLKMILPPKAVDTPQELAQLSQFVVNIVDFRDPDCTMTKFVNTDIQVNQGQAPSSATSGSTTTYTPAVPPTLAFAATPGTPYSPSLTESSGFLVQWGMENQPVAINEVLSYQFETKMVANSSSTANPAKNNIQRIWVELVNALTEAAAGNAASLDMAGWDFVIMPDDGLGRPDPYTGQIPWQPASTLSMVHPVLLNAGGASASDPQALATPIPPMNQAGPQAGSYYVFGTTAPTQTADGGKASELVPPSISAQLDLITGGILDPAFATPAPYSSGPAAGTADWFYFGKPNQFYWIYLRRPPNPFETTFDPANPNDNRVVVDSFRFMFNDSGLVGYTDSSTTPPTDKMNKNPSAAGTTAGSNQAAFYSLERLQPFRGGHAVPPVPSIAGTTPYYCIPAYGTSEQTADSVTASTLQGVWGSNTSGMTTTQVPSTAPVKHTLGIGNSTQDPVWDLFPFHDRDFTSVAELLMVPGCPPGLFTKQFAEFPPPRPAMKTPGASGTTISPLIIPPDATNPGHASWPAVAKFAQAAPHTFPYLVDQFFYTGASENTSWPAPGNGPAPVFPASTFPVTVPVGASAPSYISGPGGAGWFKMMEFFEVPSPAFGAIGPVAQGMNYDWARQDTRPGMLNLNLIVDEEVFFGLMGESWLKILGDSTLDSIGDSRLNVAQLTAAQTPLMVTQVDSTGSPTLATGTMTVAATTTPAGNPTAGSYSMNNVGFTALDPVLNTVDNRMKAAFSDFLKIRHGGSSYVFGYGVGATGQSPVLGSSVGAIASERPFHALSYPDINFTVMRPATVPPSAFTNPAMSAGGGYPPALPGTWPPGYTYGATPSATNPYYFDPGLKNPTYFTYNNPPQPEPIPARRLFQIGDARGTQSGDTIWSNSSGSLAPPTPPATAPYAGDPNINLQVQNPILANLYGDLEFYPTATNYTFPSLPLSNPKWPFLGFNGTGDNSQHPYFRTEWLQKVTNLTTVRTHQYAVWITVGFFEVLKEGDAQLAIVNPAASYDVLGQELGLLSGRNIRYRSFFLIDRTRATGFNPYLPGSFRDCITYRQLIE